MEQEEISEIRWQEQLKQGHGPWTQRRTITSVTLVQASEWKHMHGDCKTAIAISVLTFCATAKYEF